MHTTTDIVALRMGAIQCPSCLQTVTPSIDDACPTCKEDLSILLALRKVIDSLLPLQSDRADNVADNVSDDMGGPTGRPVESTGGD